MMFKNTLATIIWLIFAGGASAQQVTLDWLRSAADLCGAGVSVELDGEFEAGLLKRLSIIGGDISGEGTFRTNDVENILSQFAEQQKLEVYRDYTQCLTSVMQIATKIGSDRQAGEVLLDTDFAPAGLDIVPVGKTFVVSEGQLFAYGSSQLLMHITEAGPERVRIHQTDTTEGSNYSLKLSLGSGTKISVLPCVFTFYHFDTETNAASLLASCDE